MRFLRSQPCPWHIRARFASVVLGVSLLGCTSNQSTYTTAPSSSYIEVARVLDGDTFELSTRQKVRLLGVDAPETQHHEEDISALGRASKQHLSTLLNGERVRIEKPRGLRDPYGRTLAYAYLSDGTLINLAMIADGFAVPYTKYPCSKTSEFLKAANEARQHHRGLWQKTQFSIGDRYEVRLSTSGICHAPGNKGFERMKRYTAYRSVDACLESGGRLPRRIRGRLS